MPTKHYNILWLILLGILFSTLVTASTSNLGNISSSGWINATNDISTKTKFNGNLDWSWLQNVPSYLINWTLTITGMQTNISGLQIDNTTQAGLISVLRTDNTTQAGQIASALTDNTTQAGLISALRTDNSTQSREINLRLLITDQRYNESSAINSLNASKFNINDQLNWTQLTNYPVACPANNFMTQVGDAITCTSVQATLLSLTVNGNLTVTESIWGNINASYVQNPPWRTTILSLLDNTTQGIEIAALRQDNITQGIQIAAGITDNTTQGGLIAGLRTDNTTQAGLIAALRTDNTTQGTQIAAGVTDNTTQAELINLKVSKAGDTMTGNLVINANLTVTGIKVNITSGNIYFFDEQGDKHKLNGLATHWDELSTNTLLDKSRSTLSTVNSQLNYTLYTFYGNPGAWNFDGVIYSSEDYGVTSATITLLNGTNTTPKVNYVHWYLNAGIPTMTTTESYPSYTHIDVGTFLVGEVLGNNSVIYSYSRNRYELDTFVTRVIERFEASGTQYVSGFSALSNTTNLNISTGSFFNGIFEMTSTNSPSVKDGFYFINSTGQFIQAMDYKAFTKYPDGTAIGSTHRINVVIGLVPINTTGGTGPTQVRVVAVIQSLPSTGAYTTDATALADAAGATNYYPSNVVVKSVFTPIARVVVRPSTGVAVQFASGLYHQYIAGSVLSGGGAAVPGTSDHAALSNLAWSTAGHTIDTNVNFGSKDAYEINNLNATNLYGLLNASYIQNAPWSLQIDNTTQGGQIASLRTDNSTQSVQIAAGVTDNTTQSVLIAALRTDNTTLGGLIASLRTDNTTQAGQISANSNSIISLDLSNATQATAISGLQTDNTTQAGQISAGVTDNTTQAGLISALRTDNTTQAGLISALRTDNTTQAAQLSANLASITSLDLSNTTQATAISGLNTDNTTQAGLIAALRTDNTTVGAQISLLRTDNTTQGLLISALRTDNTTIGLVLLTKQNIVSTYPAANITAGTFGTGNYIFPANVTATQYVKYSSSVNNIEAGTTGYNGTCWRAIGSSITFTVC